MESLKFHVIILYTKLLFTSLSLLLVVQSYNSTGQKISNLAVLLFDPSIKFLHSVHAPYVSVALFFLLTCIVPPPLLLILYPTRLFRKCLACFGFQRWDILQQVMDTFQGWYKDGTEGTKDYRFFSAFFLVVRIAHGGKIITLALLDNKKEHMLIQDMLVRIFQISMGILFFTLKPYKKIWMSNVDGIIFTLVGCYILIEPLNNKIIYVSVVIIMTLIIAFTLICALYRKFKT